MNILLFNNHQEDKINKSNILRRSMSIIDLAQLWMNLGGDCPF
jgi:hypothetical protein